MVFGVPTVRTRELGDAIRVAMEQANLSGKQLATLLNWTESKVSRALTGNAVPTEVDVSAMLALCGVTGSRRDYLLSLSHPETELGWQTDHRILAANQSAARYITGFHGSLIPSLLQVEGYARSVISRTMNVPFEQVEERVAARMASQQVFTRDDPPRSAFFVHELCLQLAVGGAEIMAVQLDHLLKIGARPSVTIRVVPIAAGAQAGLIGSCCLLEFAEFEPVAYIDNEVAGLFVEEADQIATYQKVFTGLATVALDEGASSARIRTVAKQYVSQGRAG